jgi:hypothetical protein
VEDSLEFVENSASAMQESTYSSMGWVMGIIPVDSPSHRGVFNWDEDKRRSISVGQWQSGCSLLAKVLQISAV